MTRALIGFDITPAAGATWSAGDYIVRLNITGATTGCNWVATYICRLNSSNVSQATIGSLTGQSIALSPTGVKEMTISGASQTPSSGDKIYCVLVFAATTNNRTINFTSDQLIDTPITVPETYPKSGTDGASAEDEGPAPVWSGLKSGTDGAKGTDGATQALAFDSASIKQAIIDGLVSAQSEGTGWNARRSTIPTSAVVRTNSTTVTITLPADSGYDISADETITCTVPLEALTNGGADVEATPTISLTFVTEGQTYPKSGTDGAKGTDDATVTHTLPHSGTDGATATDASPAPIQEGLRTGTDGAKATDDAPAPAATRPKSGTDGAKGTDAGTNIWAGLKSGTDGAKATDDATPGLQYAREATDGAKATDDSTRVLVYPRDGTDGAKATDASTVTRTRAPSATDGAKGTDSSPAPVQTGLRTGTDGAKAADNSTTLRTRAATGTDGAKATDGSTNLRTRAATGTDGAKATDGATRQLLTGFDAVKQAIINGFVSAQNEGTGWNARRSLIPLSAVVRTSATQVTITLPADAGYDITADETITCTVPGAALTGGNPLVATPTWGIAIAGILATGTDGVKAGDSETGCITAKAGTDGAKATDSAVAKFLKSATDGAKATDASPLAVTARPTSNTDGAKVVDTGTNLRTRAPIATDGAKAGENASAPRTRPPAATDGAKGTDASTVARTRRPAGIDGAKGTDAASFTLNQAPSKAGTDGAKGTDASTVTRTRTPEGTDGATGADAAPTVWAGTRIGSDGATASENAVGTVESAVVFARTGDDGAKATDDATVTGVHVRAGLDGAKGTDDAAGIVNTVPSAGSDGAKAADSSSVTLTQPADGTDAAIAADSSTVYELQYVSGTDGATGADAGAGERTRVGDGTDGATTADDGDGLRTPSPTDDSEGVLYQDEGITVYDAVPLEADGTTATDEALFLWVPSYIPIASIRMSQIRLLVPDLIQMTLTVPPTDAGVAIPTLDDTEVFAS